METCQILTVDSFLITNTFSIATGCLDIKSPPNSWHERHGQVLTISCYSSDQTWNLKCVGTKWIGVVGNCTSREGEAISHCIFFKLYFKHLD